MKLHPDVNPSQDAKQQFMECKTAYETLIDPDQRGAYDRSRRGGFGAGLGGDFGADWDNFGEYARRAAQSAPQYSYEDLLKDLDRELESWQQERAKRKGKRAETVEDVLYDIGDEFLEFLEMGLPKEKEQAARNARNKQRDSGGDGGASGSSSARGHPSSGSSSDYYRRPTPEEMFDAAAEEVNRRAGEMFEDEEVRKQANTAAEAAARAAKQAASKKASEIDDELAAIKRKLGL